MWLFRYTLFLQYNDLYKWNIYNPPGIFIKLPPYCIKYRYLYITLLKRGLFVCCHYTTSGDRIYWSASDRVVLYNTLTKPKSVMLQIMFQQTKVGNDIFIVRYILLNKQTLSSPLSRIFQVPLNIIQICITYFYWRKKMLLIYIGLKYNNVNLFFELFHMVLFIVDHIYAR